MPVFPDTTVEAASRRFKSGQRPLLLCHRAQIYELENTRAPLTYAERAHSQYFGLAVKTGKSR